MNNPPRYIPAKSSTEQNRAKGPQTLKSRSSNVSDTETANQQPTDENHSRDNSHDHSRDAWMIAKYRAIIHRLLDQALADALLELSMLPGNVAGRSYESSSFSTERQLPVDTFGNARGDTTEAKLKRRASRARSAAAKRQVLEAIRSEIDLIKKPKRRSWADTKTPTGRMAIARAAIAHGNASAAETYGVTTRTVTEYRREYRRITGTGR